MSRLFFMLLTFPVAAIAQLQLPNEIDLKAAYCIPIVLFDSQIEVDRNLPEPLRNNLQESKDKGITNLRRINLYLVPRLSLLEVMPLVGAKKSAEEDLDRIKSEIRKCNELSSVKEALNCMSVETETLKRARSCKALSFLPF
jgi:hypothetical protein